MATILIQYQPQGDNWLTPTQLELTDPTDVAAFLNGGYQLSDPDFDPTETWEFRFAKREDASVEYGSVRAPWIQVPAQHTFGYVTLTIPDFAAIGGTEQVTFSGTVTGGTAVGIMVQVDEGGGFVDFAEYTGEDIAAFATGIAEAIAAGTYDFRAAARSDVGVTYGSVSAPWSSVESAVEVVVTSENISIVSVSPTNLSANQYTFLGQGTNIHSLGVGNDISAVVDIALNVATVTTDTVKAHDGTSYLSGTVSYDADEKRISFVPTANFGFNKTITMTLVSGASGILGANGEELAEDYTWSFSTFATRIDVSGITWGISTDGTSQGDFTPTGAGVFTYNISETDADYINPSESKDEKVAELHSRADTDERAVLVNTAYAMTNYTARARMKLMTPYSADQFRIDIRNAARAAVVQFQDNNLVLRYGSFNVNNYKYRTYHLVSDGTTVDLYLDDNPTPVITQAYTDLPAVGTSENKFGIMINVTTEVKGRIDFGKVVNATHRSTVAV